MVKTIILLDKLTYTLALNFRCTDKRSSSENSDCENISSQGMSNSTSSYRRPSSSGLNLREFDIQKS